MPKFLTNVDLVQNQLQNAVIQVRTAGQISAISNPRTGQIVYDSTNNKIKIYNGSAWTDTVVSNELSGTTLASNIVNSSLTSIGTLNSLTVNGTATATTFSGSGANLTNIPNSATTATANNTSNTIVARDGSGNFATNQITISGTPTNATDVVNKAYVDTLTAGINWHDAVQFATDAVLPNSPNYVAGSADQASGTGIGAYLIATTYGRLQVDGNNASNGERVLVKNQADAKQNGIYVVNVQGDGSNYWKLIRSSDYDNSINGEVKSGDAVFAIGGVNNLNQGFIQNTVGSNVDKTIRIGTDNISFTQFTGTSAIVAGVGLSKSGNTLNVSLVPIANGGTNATRASAARTNLAAQTTGSGNALATKYAGNITHNGSATSFTVNHNLGTRDVSTQIYEVAAGVPTNQVFCDVSIVDADNLSVIFASAETSGVIYRVVVTG